MGKLLKHFIEETGPDDVMSYADLEWTDGDVYRKLGLRKGSLRPPVRVAIDPATYVRKPLSGIVSGEVPGADSPCLYHVNLGSAKYRLDIP